METTYIVLSAIISLIAIGGSILAGKKLGAGATKEQIQGLISESAELQDRLTSSGASAEGRFSKPQLTSLVAQTEEFVQALEAQKQLIKDLEVRLEQAQKDVEAKEGAQQEMKSAKEEDENRLSEITAAYDTYSSQSVSLEHQLAASLKNLDTMIIEVPMTTDQKAVFQELSNTLTSASGRLRDLFIDYQAVHERLEGLKSQHKDLEEEYTKLVEQQLSM
jgi:chromosome segregation ATPase